MDSRGQLKPFFGDTVVFLLDEPVMERLAGIQGELDRCCAHILAKPLDKSTLHLTLHDLNSGSELTDELSFRMERSYGQACRLLREIRERGPMKIAMKSTWLFNMMNTSVVLGFAPVDEDNCRKLMGLYEAFQSVVKLPYRLTPHITMAYYQPGVYPWTQLEGLEQVIRQVEKEGPLYLELDAEKLVYQRFTSMDRYETWEY